MEDKSIDFVLTSVPFKDDEVPKEYYVWFGELLKQFDRIVKHYSFIFNSSTRLKEICRRFNPERILVWAKRSSLYPYRFEPIFVFNHGSKLKINSRVYKDCLVYEPIPNADVPYSNPLGLYYELVKMLTRKGEYVLDTFMGRGTSAVACKMLDRHFTGIEINPEYFNMAEAWVCRTYVETALREEIW
jgi:site-specific DNA-methyltransferase (adenine-specific)